MRGHARGCFCCSNAAGRFIWCIIHLRCYITATKIRNRYVWYGVKHIVTMVTCLCVGLCTSLMSIGLPGPYFMSHWYLLQPIPTDTAPYIVLTHSCFLSNLEVCLKPLQSFAHFFLAMSPCPQISVINLLCTVTKIMKLQI